MTKIGDCYCIETESFVLSSVPQKSDLTSGIKGSLYPYVYAPHTQNPHNPNLSCCEVFAKTQTFCGNPNPLNLTQYSDFFVAYTEGFKMHTGHPNPQSVIEECISC